MGLDDLIDMLKTGIDYDRFRTPNHELEVLDDTVPDLAKGGDKAQTYKVQMWEEFKIADDYPLREREQDRVDRHGRHPEVYELAMVRTRFLRALTAVAERNDVGEATVRQACTGMYDDSGDYDYMTTRFAFDLKTTENEIEASTKEDV